MYEHYFALTATLCLLVALLIAWLLIAYVLIAWLLIAYVAPENPPIAKIFPSFKELLRSHIDYLMMAQFLFIFYGLSRFMDLSIPAWIVISACIGAFFNPFGFFIRAIKPNATSSPIFVVMIMTSSVLTTVGFAATAIMIAKAALDAR